MINILTYQVRWSCDPNCHVRNQFCRHQRIKEILRMGYNHHNWWQLVTLVMMVREYRRSNHNAISVITRHRQTRNSPWSSRLATISYLILTSHNVDAKFSVHSIAFHVIQTLIRISQSIHRWHIKKESNILESELGSIRLWYNSMTPHVIDNPTPAGCNPPYRQLLTSPSGIRSRGKPF